MKKSISVVLLVVMLVGCFSAVALARYTYIRSVTADIFISSAGKATVGGTVNAFDSNRIDMKIELEYKPASGGSWKVWDNWSDYVTNSTRYTDSGSCSVGTGNIYRTKVTGTVRGENAIAYSGECSY